MGRKKPAIKFAASMEVEAAGPLDARTVVPTKADLTLASNFPYAYAGLNVYVEEEQKIYTLTAADVTVLANWKEVGSSGGGNENAPEFSTLNSSASIEQTEDNTLHRLSIGLEDNTQKIAVHIWNGDSEKQWHAETEQSLRQDADAGLTPDLTLTNSLGVTTSEKPGVYDYVMLDRNSSLVGERVTDESPYIYNRIGTSTEMVRLTVGESQYEPGWWDVSAFDGTMDQKTWNFFSASPVVPRVQTWLKLPDTTVDQSYNSTSEKAQSGKAVEDAINTRASLVVGGNQNGNVISLSQDGDTVTIAKQTSSDTLQVAFAGNSPRVVEVPVNLKTVNDQSFVGVGNLNITKSLTQAEYDALTAEEKNNGTTYFITDGQAGSSREYAYTTTERIIGSYLGKVLYEKTLTNITLPKVDVNQGASKMKFVALNTLGFDDNYTIIDYEGVAKIDGGAMAFTLPWVYADYYSDNSTPKLNSYCMDVQKAANGQWLLYHTYTINSITVTSLTLRYVKEVL